MNQHQYTSQLLVTIEQLKKIDRKVYPYISVKEKLFEGWLRENGKPRQGLHASDFVNCQRRSAFEHIHDTVEVTEQKIKWFQGGKDKHKDLQRLLGPDFSCENELKFEYGGVTVTATPDAVYKQDGSIVELKTAEAVSVLKAPRKAHVRQTKIYMALTDAPYGKILYLIMGRFDVPTYFPEHLVTFDDEGEKEQILYELGRDAMNMDLAIKNKDASRVPHQAENREFFGRDGNYLCLSCPFKQECDQIRGEAGEAIN